jgi:hypothetical protein
MAAPTTNPFKKGIQFVFKTVKIIVAVLFICFHSYAGKPLHLKEGGPLSPTDTVISGIVKDANGKPIPNAKITSAVAGDVFTNSDGLFSITLKTDKIKPQNLVFSYDTLMPVVRSYHPVMENAMYEIVLEPKKCCLCDLLRSKQQPDDMGLGSLDFKPEAIKLSNDAKMKLKEIAERMKADPELKIIATAYPSTNKTRQRVAGKRLGSIVQYLNEQEGISSDRIATEQETAEGDNNMVEFKKQ